MIKWLSNHSKSPNLFIASLAIYSPVCNLFCAKEATFRPISNLCAHKTFITLFCVKPPDAIFYWSSASHPVAATLPNNRLRKNGLCCLPLLPLSTHFCPISPTSASLATIWCFKLFWMWYHGQPDFCCSLGDREKTRMAIHLEGQSSDILIPQTRNFCPDPEMGLSTTGNFYILLKTPDFCWLYSYI